MNRATGFALVLIALACIEGSLLNHAFALGTFPKPPGGPGSAPTPGPIAGGGIVWLGVVAVAGIYMLVQRFRQR